MPPSNRLQKLSADREGQYAISINDQWRICCRFVAGNAYEVELIDYHSPKEKVMAILFDELERTIPPTHPGEMLKEDFLPDYGLTATTLARALGVSSKSVNDLLNQRRGLSLGMALRLARLFGNTPEFWLNAQRAVDVWKARPKYQKQLREIQPLG